MGLIIFVILFIGGIMIGDERAMYHSVDNIYKTLDENELNKIDFNRYHTIENCSNLYKLDSINRSIIFIPVGSNDEKTITCRIETLFQHRDLIIDKIK